MVPSVVFVWSRAAALVVVGMGLVGLTGCDAPADDGPEPAVPQAWTTVCDEADGAAGGCLADGPLRCGDGVLHLGGLARLDGTRLSADEALALAGGAGVRLPAWAPPGDDEAKALRLANGTAFGLVAGVWTRDGARQMRLARQLRCGQVFVNNYGAGGGIELPFGGVKASGYGREKGFEALLGFTTLKTIAVRHG
jgi:hypothetical protein